jgi:hypothetical protein
MTDTTTIIRSTEDLLRRIAGLLSTAESFADQGNEEAANAYVQKAHQLQAKYSIDQAMLEAHNRGQFERTQIITKTWDITGSHGNRRVDLAHIVSKTVGCAGYFTTDRRRNGKQDKYGRNQFGYFYSFTAFGYPADVEWAEMLYHSLSNQLDAEMTWARKKWKREKDVAVKAGYRARDLGGKNLMVAFIAAFNEEVGLRLLAAVKDAENQAMRDEMARTNPDVPFEDAEDLAAQQKEAAGTVALVLADKRERVKKEMNAKVSGLRTKYSTAPSNSRGYRDGKIAGGRANISKGGMGKGGGGQLGGGGGS